MKKFALLIILLAFLLLACQTTGKSEEETIAPTNTNIPITATNTVIPTSTSDPNSVWVTVTPETEIVISNMELIGKIDKQTPQFAAPAEKNYASRGIALKTLVRNDTSFVVQGANGSFNYDWARLSIIDISNPKTPVLLGSYATDSRIVATDIAILSTDIVYLTDGQCEFGMQACIGSLYIIDISNPSNPTLVKKIGLEQTYAKRIERIYNYLYMISSSYNEGTWASIYEISNLEQPVFVKRLSFSGALYDVNIHGKYAYFSTEDGLHIADVTNLANPVEVGFVSVGDRAFASYVKGNFAYVAIGNSGFAIVDISNPKTPILKSTLKIYGRAVSVTGKDNLIYVAAENGGLRIFDISIQTNPIEIAHYNSSGYIENVTVDDKYIYASDVVEGLLIFRVVQP